MVILISGIQTHIDMSLIIMKSTYNLSRKLMTVIIMKYQMHKCISVYISIPEYDAGIIETRHI